jgi:hypothetical protein
MDRETRVDLLQVLQVEEDHGALRKSLKYVRIIKLTKRMKDSVGALTPDRAEISGGGRSS